MEVNIAQRTGPVLPKKEKKKKRKLPEDYTNKITWEISPGTWNSFALNTHCDKHSGTETNSVHMISETIYSCNTNALHMKRLVTCLMKIKWNLCVILWVTTVALSQCGYHSFTLCNAEIQRNLFFIPVSWSLGNEAEIVVLQTKVCLRDKW